MSNTVFGLENVWKISVVIAPGIFSSSIYYLFYALDPPGWLSFCVYIYLSLIRKLEPKWSKFVVSECRAGPKFYFSLRLDCNKSLIDGGN